MNDNLSVRSLLVEKTTGKFIKAVDERDLSDFLPLLIKGEPQKSEVVLFDFSGVIQYFHKELESKLARRDHRELAVKRATVFNTWSRLKTLTNEIFLCQVSSTVMRDSEEVLNWIYTRLPELEGNYYRANDNAQQPCISKKTEALLKLSDEIEVFIEILLCNIHATAKVDIKSFKSDFVITEHCGSIKKLVLKALGEEAGFFSGAFKRQSPIYHCCMEDLGINPEALIFLLESDDTVERVKGSILRNAVTEDYWDGYENQRKYSVSWPRADVNVVTRLKILSALLEKINLLLVLMEKLKSSEVYFEKNPENQEDFERDIKILLSKKT